MKSELTEDEKQATLDAIERFRESDPDLKKTYEIEFIVADTDSSTPNSIAWFLNQNEVDFKTIKNSGSDILVVIQMKLDKDEMFEIESSLTYFANKHGFKYDGWGAFE